MGLADFRKARTSNNGGGNSNLGGAAIKVIGVQNADGVTTIEGELLFDSLGREAGSVVKVGYNPDNASRIADNLKRGFGASKESILLLENVVAGKGDDHYVARWITTARSATKALDETTGHHIRSVEAVILATPTVLFPNPTPANNEPEYINFGLTSSEAWIPVKRNGGERRVRFDRDWLREKLSQALNREATRSANDKFMPVQLSALALAPESSFLAGNIDEAINEILEITGNPNMVALVRIRDENNEVAAAQIRRVYQQTDDELKAQLTNGLVRDVPMDALAGFLADGSWQLEVITGSDIPYLGETRLKVLKEIAETPLEELYNYNFTFGEDAAGRVVDSIIVTMPTKEGTPCFAHEPIRLTGKKRSAISYLATPHFDVPEPVREQANRNDNAGGAEGGSTPAPGGESFSAEGASEDDYSFDQASEADVQEGKEAAARTTRTRRLS